MTYGQIQQAYFEGRELEVKKYFDTLKDSGKVWVHRDLLFPHIIELIKDFKATGKHKRNLRLQKKVGTITQQIQWHGYGEDSTLGIVAKRRYLETIEIQENGDYHLVDAKYSQPPTPVA